MAQSQEIDQAKAIGLPILLIVALLLAGFITRKTLAKGFAAVGCCSDLRLGILYWGGITNVILSVFLFPTAGWAYGLVNSLFSYTFALATAPTMLDKHANKLFVGTSVWFSLLIGIPNMWTAGLITRITTGCKAWFPVKTDMCSAGWQSFSVVVAIFIILSNFFTLLVLMAFAFDNATQNKAKAQQQAGAGVQQPLNSNNGDDDGKTA